MDRIGPPRVHHCQTHTEAAYTKVIPSQGVHEHIAGVTWKHLMFYLKDNMYGTSVLQLVSLGGGDNLLPAGKYGQIAKRSICSGFKRRVGGDCRGMQERGQTKVVQ